MTGASDGLTLTARLALLSSISYGGFPTVLPDVRDERAGAGRRVELADVVAGLVGPQLRELGAGADPGRAPLAR